MDQNRKDNVGEVISNNLCCWCGFCEGICPQNCIKQQYDEKDGIYRPVVIEENCSNCGLCLTICPGRDADLLSTVQTDWESAKKYNSSIGYYSQLYWGYSYRRNIRKGGSSGGVATELLSYMLVSGLIDGAVTTVMSDQNPLVAEPVIARSLEEIQRAQQSKYCPVSLHTLMKSLKKDEGRYAFLGLPCTIHAIRKMQKIDNRVKKIIPYTIGLFCSRTPSFNATNYILDKRNISKHRVRRIKYRNGDDHIGHMEISLTDNKVIKVPHLHFDYWGYMFQHFFIPPRCYLCMDKAAVYADISLGEILSNIRHTINNCSTKRGCIQFVAGCAVGIMVEIDCIICLIGVRVFKRHRQESASNHLVSSFGFLLSPRMARCSPSCLVV